MNISDLPQEISILREERLKAENRLMQAKDMLASSLILWYQWTFLKKIL